MVRIPTHSGIMLLGEFLTPMEPSGWICNFAGTLTTLNKKKLANL